MTEFQIYLLLKLDAFRSVFSAFGLIGILLAVVSSIVFLFILTSDIFKKDDQRRKAIKISLRCLIVFAVFGTFSMLINTIIPSTKEAAVILVTPKIINNEDVKKIPAKVAVLANEWLEELRPKKK